MADKKIFPLSDLDVLILSKEERESETEEKIAQFVQFLWDCGFDVGHSVRSLEECERKANRILLLPPICLSPVIYRVTYPFLMFRGNTEKARFLGGKTIL